MEGDGLLMSLSTSQSVSHPGVMEGANRQWSHGGMVLENLISVI